MICILLKTIENVTVLFISYEIRNSKVGRSNVSIPQMGCVDIVQHLNFLLVVFVHCVARVAILSLFSFPNTRIWARAHFSEAVFIIPFTSFLLNPNTFVYILLAGYSMNCLSGYKHGLCHKGKPTLL